MRWFRMYGEFATDPKVQSMDEVMQRRLIMLMCLHSCNDLVTLHETEIAFALRISDGDLGATKRLFVGKGFIDDNWNILNWEKRQYKSDSSLERVRKHRAATVKQPCNVTVTPPDTDTEQKEDKPSSELVGYSPDFEKFWLAYPKYRRREKPKALQAWKQATKKSTAEQILAALEKYKRMPEAEKFAPYPAKWLKGEYWAEVDASGVVMSAEEFRRTQNEKWGLA